jgi:hypothetical protein
MTFDLALSPVIKIALTRQRPLSMRTRSLAATQAALGEVVLDTRVGSLVSHRLVVRLSVSSMTSLMRGADHVVGQPHTPPNIMMIGMLAKAHLSSMISTH